MAIGHAPVAFAGGSIVQSATRMAQQAGRQAAPVLRASASAPARSALAAQPPGGGLSASGMSKRRKLLVALVVGVSVVGAIYAIDHSVLDVTPSSRGTRKD